MNRIRIISALLFALFLTAPLHAQVFPLFESVARFIVQKDGEPLGGCTMGMVDEQRGLWLTVAHCVDAGDTIAVAHGKVATVRSKDTTKDLAVLVVPEIRGRALKLARRAPQVGDAVSVVGYPYGHGPMLGKGTISAVSLLMQDGRSYMFYTSLACPGSSGSPVVNRRGELVSVHQMGLELGCSPPKGGVTYEDLKEFLVKALKK